MRILALATHGEAGPSTRFRVLQWATHLKEAGFLLSLEAFFSPAMTVAFYQPGRPLAKLADVTMGAVRRLRTLARLSHLTDLLLIHREAFPLGRRPFWNVLERFPGPIIYDYDDAMFLRQRGGRGALGWFENVETPKAVMAISDVVFAGNRFLAEYARPYAQRVVVLPTCIDTARFVPRPRAGACQAKPLVGWIGSYTASPYLFDLVNVLEAVAEQIPFRLYAVGCYRLPPIRGVDVEQVDWNLAREVEDFQRCDIGIYPLRDDGWGRGKCAFKAIQFMACGIPVLASAVGMNLELIQDGVNGYLASTPEEWVDKLTRLLEDPQLRLRLGRVGRQTVEARYAVHVHAPKLLGVLRETLNGRSGT